MENKEFMNDNTRILTEQETLELLAQERKFTININNRGDDENYRTERVNVNGVTYQIPVGEDVEVPETVYKRLKIKGVI